MCSCSSPPPPQTPLEVSSLILNQHRSLPSLECDFTLKTKQKTMNLFCNCLQGTKNLVM